MSMTQQRDIILVKKDDIATVVEAAVPLAPLAENAVRLRVESFAMTANNVTYAHMGASFGYWHFFPSGIDNCGIVPMWGHAIVTESRCADIAVGERVYGYLPMASHLDVVPSDIKAGQFRDATDYRQPMSVFYNLYSRLAADPEHDPAREDARMIFGPLFKTGFLIEAFMRREGWFGAQSCIMTSASSKTAMALAHCVKDTSPQIKRVGMTSARNVDFVRRTGLYDDVIAYDAPHHFPEETAVLVDFAGNADVLRAVHEASGAQLKYSCMVGATHLPSGMGAEDLPGPKPQLFFAPDHVTAIIKELGPQGFFTAVAKSWAGFVVATDSFVRVDHRDGLGEAADIFALTVKGEADPAVGVVVRP
jgi:hypothetical protein